MIYPIQCFGHDTKLTPIFPEESHVKSNKFMFPKSLYSFFVKKSNIALFAKYPNFFQINFGYNSIKLTRQFIITDEFERNEIFTELSFSHNNYSKVTLKLPYGFIFDYRTDDTLVYISDKSFCYSKYDQSRENYKYFFLFSLGEKINFINQVQYSTKTLLSVFYNVDQLALVHSVHPFTPNLLISSCLKMRNVGPFDFFQKIQYKSNKYKFVLGLFDIIRDLQKMYLRKNSIGINLIKKFKYLTTGFQIEFNQQNFFQTSPVFYFKYNFHKVSPIILTDFKKTKLGFKINYLENTHFQLFLMKYSDDKKIGFNVKYVFDD